MIGRTLLHRLGKARSGVAMTEFALSLPLLMTAGLYGVEVANYTVTTMRVNQLAVHLADNAARIGDTSTLQNRKIYESDINDLLVGANIQGGSSLDFFEHGRAIISSLEVLDGTTDQQYIHWQRCKGKLSWTSHYGEEGDGLDGALPGMGPPGEEVTASAGDAVIFVEVAYQYQPLISGRFITSSTIRSTSAFMVRDDRDLSQIYQQNALSPDPIARCDTFDS